MEEISYKINNFYYYSNRNILMSEINIWKHIEKYWSNSICGVLIIGSGQYFSEANEEGKKNMGL